MRTPVWEKADAEARGALEELAKEVDAREVDLPPDFNAAWEAHRAIMAADMAFNLGALLDQGGEVSKAFRDLIAEGRKVTATQYLAAVRDARRYADGIAWIFEQIADAIITLSAPGAAPQGLGATGNPAFCTLLDADRAAGAQSAAHRQRRRAADRRAARSARRGATRRCCARRALIGRLAEA